MNHLEHLFTSEFMPHGHCYFWSPDIVWTNTIADTIIAISYFAIPVALARIAKKRKDINFRPLLVLFGIFIVACGLTHIFDIITIWHPIYRVSSTVKAITAMASLPTAFVLFKLVPKILAIPSNNEWMVLNAALQAQIEQLKEKDKTIDKIEEFRFLADSIPQIIWTTNLDGKMDYGNQHWYDYTGLAVEQFKELTWSSIVHPEDLKVCVDTWRESVKTGKDFQIQFRLKRAKDGDYRWHLGRAIPMKNERGVIVKWFGTFTDIDDFIKSRESLKVTRANLNTILENVPMVLWSIDCEGIYTYVEGKGMDNLGFQESLIGQSHFEIFKEYPDLTENVKRALRGESFNYSIQFNERVLETFYNPLKDENQLIIGMVAVSFDVTEGKRAQTANHLKSRFLANMSHEIRTPLNAILGFSRILNTREMSENQRREYISHISSSGLILLKLIGDILDLNKIEEGKMDLHPHVFDFKEVVLSALNPYKYKANEKGLIFKILFDEDIPKYVKSDSCRILQILINLIGNAIKFTREGSISISFENLYSKNDSKAFLKISVTDTGIGIPEDKQALIFESFVQADASIVREYGGSGLGLNITKQIANLLGGEIKIISPSNVLGDKGGAGSMFQFTFEVEVEHVAPPEIDGIVEDSDFSSTLKILVAEDNTVNQLLIKAMLEDKVAVLKIVNNGLEAINVLNMESFDLVLMDIQMPIMDGYTASREIRERGFSMPIIGITANVHKDDIENCFKAGMNDFIGKPINDIKLYQIIKKWSFEIPSFL